MKGQFTGKLDIGGDLDFDETGEVPFLVIDGRPVSLRALAALSPDMLAVLEVLARPESKHGFFRVDREGEQVRLTKVGVMAHAGSKLADSLQRRRIRAS